MDVFVWLLAWLTGLVAVLIGLFFLGKLFRKALFPLLLPFVLVPFYWHVTRFNKVTSWTGTEEARVFVENAVARFNWTSGAILAVALLIALVLTWRVPLLASIFPFTLFALYNNFAYDPFAATVQAPVAQLWLDDYGHNLALFIQTIFLSLCLFSYTLPRLLQHMKDTMPDMLRREVEPRA